ncbi:MAG: ABC transporter ATP-binding protein [Propionibacteriaceae bacterium]|jgi:branched-chain amino acid transport system ATP-binding protein|nr:ABC transporter ATP-binding protein [Propionibacteriaceae bacterium]
MFEIRDLNVHFGGIHALQGVSLYVNEGEIVTLIGANGAGKSTTLRTASGLKKPTSGQVFVDGQEITNLPTSTRVKMGLCQVPEGRRVFPRMTVSENLDLGAFQQRDRAGQANDLAGVFQRFPVLAHRRKQLAGTLSGGEQQMLAIGRAMMARPRFLLMDEPSMGLSPLLVQEIFDIILSINAAGTTILLVEQNANKALQVAHRAYVMETGRIVMSGSAAELSKTEDIRRVYLGG